jgi:hypothetical protein
MKDDPPKNNEETLIIYAYLKIMNSKIHFQGENGSVKCAAYCHRK